MELWLILALIVFSVLAAVRVSINESGSIIPSPSLKGYGVANNNASTSQVILSVLGTTLGGAITIGFIGLIYRNGTAFYIAGLSFLLGLTMLFATISKVRKQAIDNNVTNFEEYLSGGNNYLVILISIVNIFAFIGLLASQIISLKLILQLSIPLHIEWIFPLIIISVVLYTSIYGLLGVMENDKVQLSAIMLWVAAIIFVLMSDTQGVLNITSLDPKQLNGLSMGIPFIVVVIMFLPWTALARADYWQRIVAAKTDNSAKTAYGTLIITMFFMYTLFAICGLYLAANYPGLDYNKAPFEILKFLPDAFVTLAIFGIIAALISSADSFLNISALSIMSLARGISNSLSKQENNNLVSPQNDEILGRKYRIVTILVGVFSYILVMLYDDLGVWVIMSTSAVGLIVPSFLGNMLNPDGSKTPSIASISVGILCYALALITDKIDPDKAFIVAILGATVTYIVTAVVFKKLLLKQQDGN